MRIVKKYWLPLLALVLAIGLAVWRIGYLERTNTSLSMEIGSREALQNGEPITLENPVILYKPHKCGRQTPGPGRRAPWRYDRRQNLYTARC